VDTREKRAGIFVSVQEGKGKRPEALNPALLREEKKKMQKRKKSKSRRDLLVSWERKKEGKEGKSYA